MLVPYYVKTLVRYYVKTSVLYHMKTPVRYYVKMLVLYYVKIPVLAIWQTHVTTMRYNKVQKQVWMQVPKCRYRVVRG